MFKQVVDQLKRLLAQLPESPARLWVAFSGGADSTFLLHALSRACGLPKLHAIHVNHGISQNAEAWANHCQQQCSALNVSFVIDTVSLGGSNNNLEARARDARYAAFQNVLKAGDVIVLAHHQNDQAETLLLNLLRGAGVDGLAAMPAIRALGEGYVLRPMLGLTRQDIESELTELGIDWIDDESNQNTQFDRNYIRQRVMPLLVDRWPKAAESLSRTSNQLGQAKQQLEELFESQLKAMRGSKGQLLIASLVDLAEPKRIALIRAWLKKLNLSLSSKHLGTIDQMLFASEDAQPAMQFGYCSVYRFDDALWVEQDFQYKERRASDGVLFDNISISPFEKVVWKQTELGICPSFKGVVQIKFRQGGEKIKPAGQAHHRDLKKLFQEWKVPFWRRDYVPLVYFNDELIAVVGHCVADDYKNQSGAGWWPSITTQ